MSGLRAVLFDLDDTLYDEEEYVRQAFYNTADYLARLTGEPQRTQALYDRMLSLLAQNGRGRIFDDICAECGADIPIDRLVDVYRSTRPHLTLYPDAEETLAVLSGKGIRTGLITDGCGQVQHRKIEALGLDKRLDCVLATDDCGWSKPQTQVYESCLRALGCAAGEAAYVGDNPRKDFIGARALGMQTFRIVRERGMCMGMTAPCGYEADHRITALTELLSWIG